MSDTQKQFNEFALQTLRSLAAFSMSIQPTPWIVPKPKFKLSEQCPVSDSFRQEMNQWLLDRFGFDDEQVVITGNKVYMSKRLAERFLQQLKSDKEE